MNHSPQLAGVCLHVCVRVSVCVRACLCVLVFPTMFAAVENFNFQGFLGRSQEMKRLSVFVDSVTRFNLLSLSPHLLVSLQEGLFLSFWDYF